VGDGLPGSRDAEGEDGESFYIARGGRRPEILVAPGEGRRGGSIVPSSRIWKSPIETSGDIGREARKGEPRDPRWVPSPKVDGQMGAGGGPTMRLRERSREQR
jgi:hypothetical protein